MKKINNLILWLLFIIYEEMVFSISIFNSIKSIVYVILFSTMFAVIFHLLTTINKKNNIIISYIIVIVIIGIFTAQFIYYNIYQAIISLYSATNAAGQIWQFSETILEIILNKWYIIVLFILPFIGLITLHKMKKINFEIIELKQRLIEISIGLSAHIIALVCIITINTDEIYSNRNLYYNVHAPTISANNFGILTTIRLDLQRLLFGFQEKTNFAFHEIDNRMGEKSI